MDPAACKARSTHSDQVAAAGFVFMVAAASFLFFFMVAAAVSRDGVGHRDLSGPYVA